MTDYKALCAELANALTAHGPLPGAVPLLDRARAALAEGAGVGVTDEDLAAAALKALEPHRYATELPYFLSPDSSEYEPFMLTFRAVLARYGTTHPRPIPVADTRYEFSVFDSEDNELAGFSASTLADAVREGSHYLAIYSSDEEFGPYRLELREVRTLGPATAIPLPEATP